MARTAVATDSNSGITQEQGKELGIFVLPMPFFIKGKLHFEDIDLTQEQFTALTNLCRLAVVTAVYDSPFTGQSVTQVVILTLGGSHQVPMRGKMYYDEVQITMREK